MHWGRSLYALQLFLAFSGAPLALITPAVIEVYTSWHNSVLLFYIRKKEAIKVIIKVIIQSLKKVIFGVIGYSWNFGREIHWNCFSFTSKKVLKSANIFFERGWYNIVHSFSFDPLFLNSSVASIKVPFTWIRLNEWIAKNYLVKCVTGGMIFTEIRLDAR